MKHLLRAIGLLLVSASLLGQQTAPLSAEKPPEKCSLEGQVVKTGTGEPLKKAVVVLRRAEGRDEPQTAMTDSAGRFRLKDIEPGRYRLWAARAGSVRQEYGQPKPNRPGIILALAPGQQVKDIVFRMVPAAVIAGRVNDEDGEPLAGARVQALQYRYLDSGRELMTTRLANTNDRGDYRLFGLAPGRYYISATYSPATAVALAGGGSSFGEASGRSGSEEGYAPTYYPGTNEAARAVPVEVRAGQEATGIDFRLLPTRMVRIRGRVINMLSDRPRDVSVTLHAKDSGYRFFGPENTARVKESDGTFEFGGVAPGSYVVVGQWHDQENDRSYQAEVAVEVVSGDVEGVEVVIERGEDVPGALRVEGRGTAPASAPAEEPREPNPSQARARADFSDVQVGLRPAGEWMWRSNQGRVKPDGSFVVGNISKGEYKLNVTGLPPDAYVKSARLGGEDVLENGLTVGGGPLPGAFEVVVSATGGRIEGVVQKDGLPFSGASVALVPEARRRQRTDLFKSTTTDQYGRFTLRGIAPGEYKLFAWEELEPGAYRDAEFLRPFEDKGKTVRVEEGGRLTVELELIPAEEPRR